MKKLNRQDFVSDQEVRWCPGCGDYAILASMQKLLPELGIPKENIVFVAGIGCSGRFSYYMDTYGFHTIHGRATAVATGLKLMRPDLSVWVITGDGDGLSIGASHLMHLLRRNLDINVLLFNNRVYGLTKGQYSPTSEQGKISPSSPQGCADYPINPMVFALASQASFVARAIDVDAKHLQAVLKQAVQHRGTAFIEILQNCNVFNDGAFAAVTDKTVRAERLLMLEHEHDLLFGAEREQAITLTGTQAEIVGAGNANILQHNYTDRILAQVLAEFAYPELPVPMGVLYKVERPCYADRANSMTSLPDAVTLAKVLRQGHVWRVT